MSNKRSASGRADARTLSSLKKRVSHFPKAEGLTILSKREIHQDMRDILTTMEKPGSESSGGEDDAFLAEAQEEFAARKRRRIPSVAANRWVDELLYYNWRLSNTSKQMHEIVEDRRRAKNKYRAQRNSIVSQIQDTFKERNHRKKILTSLQGKLKDAHKQSAAVADRIKLTQTIEIIQECNDAEAKKKLKLLLEKDASNAGDSDPAEDSEDGTDKKLLQYYSSFVEKVPRNQLLTLSPIVETDIKCLVPGQLTEAQLQYLRNMVDVDHWERDKNELNRARGEQARLQHQHALLQERSRQQKKQLASRRVERVQMMAELNETRAAIKTAETDHKMKIAALVCKYQKMLEAQQQEIATLKERADAE